MLTIATFKWGDKYTQDHVVRLFNMLSRNLTIPWRFVLITDKPEEDNKALAALWYGPAPLWRGGISSPGHTRVIPLWNEMRDAKLCGVRLRAFGADMAEIIDERFAWIDLDVVILGNVDHIFSRPEPFIALSTPQGPLMFNGSLVMMDAGARREVYDTWDPFKYSLLPEFYRRRHMLAGGQSDEGWMTYVLMDRPSHERPRFNGGWGERRDGIYFFRHDLQGGLLKPPPDARMVIMNGRRFDPSFPEQQKLGWVREHWR
jgi:hypothetical protein